MRRFCAMLIRFRIEAEMFLGSRLPLKGNRFVGEISVGKRMSLSMDMVE